MKLSLRIVILGCLIATSVAIHIGNGDIKAGDPCTPYWYEPCGEKMLVSEEVHPCTNCEGPNVCKTLRTYRKHFYSYVYEKQCYDSYWYGRYCYYECTRTDSCNVEKNYTRTEYHCCEGFTTSPSGNDYHHYFHKDSPRYLKKHGCPRTLENSTLDCLEELGLTEFANLFRGLDLEDKLGTDNGIKFTVFAPPNEVITNSNLRNLSSSDLAIFLGCHVVKREVLSVEFFDGQKIKSLSPGCCCIHVTEIYKWNHDTSSDEGTICINGNELVIKDACFAKNGIVHVIEGIIDSCKYNKIIADIVQELPELTTLESLLVKADRLKKLNKSHPLLTLFAPTDAAFQRGSCDLGLNITQCLLADENKSSLKKFINYHIICGAEYSKCLIKRDQVTSLACYWYRSWYYYYYYECEKIVITSTDDGIAVGKTGSVIKQLDIPACNGVVHLISLPLVHSKLNLTTLCADYTINCNNIDIN